MADRPATASIHVFAALIGCAETVLVVGLLLLLGVPWWVLPPVAAATFWVSLAVTYVMNIHPEPPDKEIQ